MNGFHGMQKKTFQGSPASCVFLYTDVCVCARTCMHMLVTGLIYTIRQFGKSEICMVCFQAGEWRIAA